MHKLLIEAKVKCDTELAKYLKAGEAIRGEPCAVTYVVTNIGENPFPGGTVQSLRMASVAIGSLSTAMEKYEIPTLGKGGSSEFTHTWQLCAPGLYFLFVGVGAADNEPIEWYQHPEAKIEGPEWLGPLYVVDRERLRVIYLLEQLTKGGS